MPASGKSIDKQQKSLNAWVTQKANQLEPCRVCPGGLGTSGAVLDAGADTTDQRVERIDVCDEALERAG